MKTLPGLVLSYVQVESLLQARKAGKTTAATSTDLGLTTQEAVLLPAGVRFAGGEELDWAHLEEIQAAKNVCFRIDTAGPGQPAVPTPIQAFSEFTGRFYSLWPTPTAPSLILSGIPMHRIKETDPTRSVQEVMRAIGPIGGEVLDTATGLGYTAIQAARSGAHVMTIEIDPVVLAICRQNPWSQDLFANPAGPGRAAPGGFSPGLSRRITQVVGNSFEEIERFGDETFSVIIHDPPMMSLAGDLFSEAFYRQAHRVLKRRGRMFHYIGDPESKSGANVTRGVMRRLEQAGFARVQRKPAAFGVMAYK